MERVLSMGGRLQKLLTEAKEEAERKVEEARKKADEMVQTAKTEANRKRARAQRGTGLEEMLTEEEKKAELTALKVKEDFMKQVDEIKNVPIDVMNKAIDYVLREVLPE